MPTPGATPQPGGQQNDVEQKLRSFYMMVNPGKLGNIPQILQSYTDKETMVFFDMDTMYPMKAGWGYVRDAILGLFLSYKPDAVSQVDTLVNNWDGLHSDRPTHYVTGTFHRLWEEPHLDDGKICTRYMTARKLLLIAYRDSCDDEGFCMHANNLTHELAQHTGKELDYAKSVRARIDEAFISQILKEHGAPQEAIQRHCQEVKKAGTNMLYLDHLKMKAVRCCQPEYYLHFSTYCPVVHKEAGQGQPVPAKNGDQFKHALLEYSLLMGRGLTLSYFATLEKLLVSRVDIDNLIYENIAAHFQNRQDVLCLASNNNPGTPFLFPPWRMEAFPDSLRKPAMGMEPIDARTFATEPLHNPWSYQGRERLKAMRAANNLVYVPPFVATKENLKNPVPSNLTTKPHADVPTLIQKRWEFRREYIEKPLFGLVMQKSESFGVRAEHSYYEAWSDEEGDVDNSVQDANDTATTIPPKQPFEDPPYPDNDELFASEFRVFDAEEDPACRKELWCKVAGNLKKIRALQAVLYLTGRGFDPNATRAQYDALLRDASAEGLTPLEERSTSAMMMPGARLTRTFSRAGARRSVAISAKNMSQMFNTVSSVTPTPVGIPEEVFRSNRSAAEYLTSLQTGAVTLGIDFAPITKLAPGLAEEEPPFAPEDDPVMPLPDTTAAANRRRENAVSMSPIRGREVAQSSDTVRNIPILPHFLCPSCSALCVETKFWGRPEDNDFSYRDALPQPKTQKGAKEGKIQILRKSLGGIGGRKWQDRYMFVDSGSITWRFGATDPTPEHSLPISKATMSLIIPTERQYAIKELYQDQKQYCVFGLKCSSPWKIYWMRVNAADQSWVNFFGKIFVIEIDQQELSFEDAIWKERARSLRSQLAREMHCVERLRHESIVEQTTFADNCERTAASEAKKEWDVLAATTAEESVARGVEQLKTINRERDKLKQDLEEAKALHRKATASCAPPEELSGTEGEDEISVLLSPETRLLRLQARLAEVRRARDVAREEVQKIERMTDPEGGSGSLLTLPTRRLCVPSPPQAARPFSY